MNLVIWKNG